MKKKVAKLLGLVALSSLCLEAVVYFNYHPVTWGLIFLSTYIFVRVFTKFDIVAFILAMIVTPAVVAIILYYPGALNHWDDIKQESTIWRIIEFFKKYNPF